MKRLQTKSEYDPVEPGAYSLVRAQKRGQLPKELAAPTSLSGV